MAEIKQFTVISTFSGCGGSSLGYQLACGKVLLAVEWDQNAVDTYKLNFPDTDVYHGDIAKLSVDEILKRTGIKEGELDIFDGSPPCQGFSTCGKRNLGDSRNQLFKEYVRILRGLKPKVFVMENVSGMVKGKMRLIFVEILKELKASGYNVKAKLLNAMYFNVPQSRQRMIFIGTRNDLNLEPSHPKPVSLPINVRKAFDGLIINEKEKRFLNGKGLELYKKTIPGNNFSKCLNNKGWFSHSRLSFDETCRTILKQEGTILAHPTEPRYLTEIELKRLSSFPDDYKFHGKINDIINRIGNSVHPNFMRAIAEHIRDNILNHG